MSETLAKWDIALLDTALELRRAVSPEGLYAVAVDQEAVLRYIRPGARCFYLLTDATWDEPSQWDRRSIPPADLQELVKARVKWLGRERDRVLTEYLAQSGRFLDAPISS